MKRETIIFNNRKFHRYPEAKRPSDRKYYRGWVYVDGKGKLAYLHRYKWQTLIGGIPKGYDVHHKDGDFSYNNIFNLELIESSEHKRLHWKGNDELREKVKLNLAKAREKAKEWHGSEDGINWHKEHAKNIGLGTKIRPKGDKQ